MYLRLAVISALALCLSAQQPRSTPTSQSSELSSDSAKVARQKLDGDRAKLKSARAEAAVATNSARQAESLLNGVKDSADRTKLQEAFDKKMNEMNTKNEEVKTLAGTVAIDEEQLRATERDEVQTRREARAAEAVARHQSVAAKSIPADVTLGTPKVWGYQRIYPFLDGLFQDVSSTQLTQLTLSPNNPNAASLDAVQNAFQSGISYSRTLGINNTALQQANQQTTAYAQQQTQLLNQQSQLIQSALSAQQQVSVAQAAVNQLTAASPPASADQLTVATQTLTAASNNLTAINNQLAIVKTYLAATQPAITTSTGASTIGSLQSPSTSAPSNPPALPSQLLSLATPPGAPNSPSLPVTKQLDNQINLLWERLSRLVGTLARPDSVTGYGIDLVEIDVGLTPFQRKKQMFGVEYTLTCAEKSHSAPIVLDLFPSAAAINIVNTKYRENKISLAAILSFFTVGLNAAYNRDHLQMSQSLGQSAYISGYGVGQSTFGWLFGRNLGDDMISPGQRTVYALIAADRSCSTFTVSADKADWFKDGASRWYQGDERLSAPPANQYNLESGALNGGGDPPPYSNSLTYSPVEYDPAAATKPLVTVSIDTADVVDQQQIITINGRTIKRSRDAFGRAIAAGNSGGLLETSTVDPNSWLPTGSHSLLLTLDPSFFGRRFPDIVIATPYQTTSIKQKLNSNAMAVSVSGNSFPCSPTCANDLPPLGYPVATAKHLLLSRRLHVAPRLDQLVISVAGDQAPAAAGPSANNLPSMQVISANDAPLWGGDATVIATLSDGLSRRLVCQPAGSRLLCDLPYNNALDRPYSLSVVDPDHAAGAIKATQSAEACPASGNCAKPAAWRLLTPAWSTSSGALQLSVMVELINTQPNEIVDLYGGLTNTILLNEQHCPSASEDLCVVTFVLPPESFPNTTDFMKIRFGGHTTSLNLQYLHMNAQPFVASTNTAQTLLTGQNLVFPQLRVGNSAIAIQIQCARDGSSCTLPASGYPDKTEGYIYLLYSDSADPKSPFAFPAATLNGSTVTQLYHQPPAPPQTPTPSVAQGIQDLVNTLKSNKSQPNIKELTQGVTSVINNAVGSALAQQKILGQTLTEMSAKIPALQITQDAH